MSAADQNVLIFGATRGVGLETARVLCQQDLQVNAGVRVTSDTQKLTKLGVKSGNVDIFDPSSVTALLAQDNYRAIILSLSGKKGDPERADREGVKVIVDAAVESGITRVVMVTAIGCGDSRAAVAPKVIEILGEVLEAKTEAEAYLFKAGLDATILRPGGLTDEPASGTAIMTEDHLTMGVASRADVGRLVADCVFDPTTSGKIFHTIDPEIHWQPPLQRGEDIPPGKS